MQFQRFDTIKKKHWSPTTVSAIVRDEIYIGTRIWGKTRCSMHTGHKAVLNDETEWVRLENHHTAIIDRELFEKANEMHPKKKRSVAESRTNFTLERRKKQPALLICANCGHSLLKETEHLLKCSDARTNGDPVCRSLVIRREPMEENILGLVRQYAASMLKKGKKVSSKRQCEYKEINTTELQKQSRQLTSEKMKLYDDYKDGRIDRDSYKQRAEKISVQLDETKRKKLFDTWYHSLCYDMFERMIKRVFPLFKAYRIPLPSFRIRKMKTRWGSCSPQKCAITLNLYLAQAPAACVEYVIAHELAHLVQPNHSWKFYKVLDDVMPTHRERKQLLREQKINCYEIP